MDSAYQKFFREHAGYPKFKSKHDNHKSYTTNFTNGNITVDFENGKVKLPKLKEVRIKLHRDFSGRIKSATVSKVPSGKYYVSILVETEHKEFPHTKQNIGLDLGIKDLCIASDGRKYENPKTIEKYQRKPSDSFGKPTDKKYGKKSSSGKVNIRCIMVRADKTVRV